MSNTGNHFGILQGIIAFLVLSDLDCFANNMDDIIYLSNETSTGEHLDSKNPTVQP